MNQFHNAPMQYRTNPEQAISCAGREVSGKCGARRKPKAALASLPNPLTREASNLYENN